VATIDVTSRKFLRKLHYLELLGICCTACCATNPRQVHDKSATKRGNGIWEQVQSSEQIFRQKYNVSWIRRERTARQRTAVIILIFKLSLVTSCLYSVFGYHILWWNKAVQKLANFGRYLNLLKIQYRTGRTKPPCQKPARSVQAFGLNTPTNVTDALAHDPEERSLQATLSNSILQLLTDASDERMRTRQWLQRLTARDHGPEPRPYTVSRRRSSLLEARGPCPPSARYTSIVYRSPWSAPGVLPSTSISFYHRASKSTAPRD